MNNKTPEQFLSRGIGNFINCTDYDDAISVIKTLIEDYEDRIVKLHAKHFKESVELQSELSKQKELVEDIKKDRDEYRERYTCNQHTVLNQKATISTLQEQIEALKKERDRDKRVSDLKFLVVRKGLEQLMGHNLTRESVPIVVDLLKILNQNTQTPETTTKEEGREG